MNRVYFVEQLDCQNEMISNFDYIMSAYDILAIYKDSIQTTFNKNTLCFELNLPSENLANKVKNNLNMIEIKNYNKNYKVEADLIGDSKIGVRLKKVSG